MVVPGLADPLPQRAGVLLLRYHGRDPEQGLELVPCKYIEFIDRDLGIDYQAEMARIQQEMKVIMAGEHHSQEVLRAAFEGIGYGIE